MKKRMFRMLCVVLALALLAPNVFAATPPAEVPLADEATVTRVKNEIAQGEITDMEDLFLVAYQHLGADLEEEGMTAYINEDGTLGFTQVISTGKAKNADSDITEVAVSSLMLLDDKGEQVRASNVYYNATYDSGSGGLDNVMVYATQTAFFNLRIGQDLDTTFLIQLNKITTTLSYGLNAFSASQLVQSYEIMPNYAMAIFLRGSKTTDTPSATTHIFIPTGMDWYDPLGSDYGGYIKTTATIYIADLNLSFEVNAIEGFYGSEYYDGSLSDYIKPTP